MLTSAVHSVKKEGISITIPSVILRTGLGAGAGYLGSRIFSLCHPMIGAIYGAAVFLMSPLLHRAEKSLSFSAALEKVIKFMLYFIVGLGLAVLMNNLSAFPITFKASLILSGILLGVDLALS